MAAVLIIKQGDTWPLLRGNASDEHGPMPLQNAVSVTIFLKSGATLITGACTVINPPDADGMNWQYKWAAGDTAIAGTYQAEIEIVWDTSTTPHEIETVPNDGTVQVVIEPSLDAA